MKEMEEENGLELRLGLSFGGGSSRKSKAKVASMDSTNEEGTSSKNVNSKDPEVSFRNFFKTGNEKLTGNGKQKIKHTSNDQESFWIDLGKPLGSSVDGSNDLWSLSGKNVDDEEKSASMKRKLLFEEASFHKRREGGAIELSDSFGKNPVGFSLLKKPHVSATTEDGSTGENEFVADSEAEGSNSLSIPQFEDNARSRDIPKNHDKNDLIRHSSSLGAQVHREEIKHELGKMAFGIPVSLQSIKTVPLPFSMPVKGPLPTTNPSNSSGFSLPSFRQLMPLAKNVGPIVQATNSRDVQLAFGYSPSQLPTLEMNTSWLSASRTQNVSSFDRDGDTPNTEHPEDAVKSLHASGQSTLLSFKPPSDSMKSNAVKPAQDASFRLKESGLAAVASSPPETSSSSVIRPGISSELKFGGSGSCPELPWVSTTGPDGKTISGVTYKFNQTQVRIVCACHGSHMSPEEFVWHAGSGAVEGKVSVPSSSNPEGSAART